MSTNLLTFLLIVILSPLALANGVEKGKDEWFAFQGQSYEGVNSAGERCRIDIHKDEIADEGVVIDAYAFDQNDNPGPIGRVTADLVVNAGSVKIVDNEVRSKAVQQRWQYFDGAILVIKDGALTSANFQVVREVETHAKAGFKGLQCTGLKSVPFHAVVNDFGA